MDFFRSPALRKGIFVVIIIVMVASALLSGTAQL